MDIRRSINTRIWADDWVESLTPTEKLLWIYLLTNAQTNMLGIYEISLKRMSFETGIKNSDIENALKGFERLRKAFYWFGFIILPNWMKNQSLNSNMLTSASRLFDLLPNELKTNLLDNGFKDFESLSKGCQTLPKKEKEKEKEIEKEKEVEIAEKNPSNPDEIIFINWLKENYPKFLSVKYPLTINNYHKLIERFGKKLVKEKFDSMHCRTDFTKKYDDPYKTALNWLKRDNPEL